MNLCKSLDIAPAKIYAFQTLCLQFQFIQKFLCHTKHSFSMNDLNLQMTIDKNNHQYPCYSREILQEIRIPMIVLTTLFPQIF